jgi:hypothetical protein
MFRALQVRQCPRFDLPLNHCNHETRHYICQMSALFTACCENLCLPTFFAQSRWLSGCNHLRFMTGSLAWFTASNRGHQHREEGTPVAPAAAQSPFLSEHLVILAHTACIGIAYSFRAWRLTCLIAPAPAPQRGSKCKL